MSLDGLGLPVDGPAEAAAGVSFYQVCVLAYRRFEDWGRIEKVAEDHPASAMALLLLADYKQQAAGGLGPAGNASVDAAAALKPARREELYITALRESAGGNPAKALEAWEAVVAEFPGDLFAAKRGQFMAYIAGNAEGLLRIVGAATPSPKWYHGMKAFALEQSGDMIGAEKCAREALAAQEAAGGDPDAWLEHSLAHALYFQSKGGDAVKFLRERSTAWKREELHPFLFTHNWWHLALVLLEGGDVDAAVRIFDEVLWKEDKSDPEVQINAIGLLLRLDVRQRSEIVTPRNADVAKAMSGSPYLHEYSLHNLLRLWSICRAGGDPSELLAGLKERATAAQESMPQLQATIVPLAAALRDLQAGDGTDAKQRIAELRGGENWSAVSGSVEQRSFLLELIEGPLVGGKSA
eukprot:TRINITY_DN42945_c0_g1_i1.p1 TRINITY_DN42945_c0_g1~~TRINITY_DN42945_c0_g1_i1.p1  ORF type:complete len:410 (+),score=138.49 TRINITY_DN42945_c0_g1_i1:58-1287(+)